MSDASKVTDVEVMEDKMDENEVEQVVDGVEFNKPEIRLYDEKERNETGNNKMRNDFRSEVDSKRMLDLTRDKPVKITVRVLVPVRDHPNFNFVGKLLGPKGNSLKRLQENTMTKMAILGRGSMKNKLKEEELRASGDPKFAHLLEDLHIEITAVAPAAEAYARIACALSDVRRFLVPDYNDDIRQEQRWELQALRELPEKSENFSQGIHPIEKRTLGNVVRDPETGSPSSSQESRSPRTSLSAQQEEYGTCPMVATPEPPPFGDGKTCQFSTLVPNSAVEISGKRKRPWLCSKHPDSPIKRTILSILTKSRTSQPKQLPEFSFIH